MIFIINLQFQKWHQEVFKLNAWMGNLYFEGKVQHIGDQLVESMVLTGGPWPSRQGLSGQAVREPQNPLSSVQSRICSFSE